MWPETEIPHIISKCIPIALAAAVSTFSEFKHNQSGESRVYTKKPNIYTMEKILQMLATKKLQKLCDRNAQRLCASQSFALVLAVDCNASDNITENTLFESRWLCEIPLLSRRVRQAAS